MTEESKYTTVDLAFSNALRGNDRETIAKFLRSDSELSTSERDMLAQYILGEFSTKPGNRAGPKVPPTKQRDAIVQYFSAEAGGSDAMIKDIVRELGVGRSTVLSWISEANQSIDSLKNMGFDDATARQTFADIIESSKIT